jgi:hypothetical protein
MSYLVEGFTNDLHSLTRQDVDGVFAGEATGSDVSLKLIPPGSPTVADIALHPL